MSSSWSSHDGQACAGLNWDRFTSVEHAQVDKLTMKIKLRNVLFFTFDYLQKLKLPRMPQVTEEGCVIYETADYI